MTEQLNAAAAAHHHLPSEHHQCHLIHRTTIHLCCCFSLHSQCTAISHRYCPLSILRPSYSKKLETHFCSATIMHTA